LLIVLMRREQPGRVLRAAALPALVVGLILALFYIPFVLDSRFARTADDIFGNRIGSRFPYNNLADFFLRTTIYSSTYYLLLLMGVTVAALARIYRRHWPAWAAWTATALVIAGLAAGIWQGGGWLIINGVDHTWLFYALAVGVVWFLPRVSVEERTVWLWFGVAMVLSLFFVAKPNSHVYGFFSPWALIVGATLAQGWVALRRRLGIGWARAVVLPVAAALVLLFGNYAYWTFVSSNVEVLRTWAANRLPGYWTPYGVPESHSLFGFPFQNGWKALGVLYAQGVLDAPFDTNETSRVADWYSRGAAYCPPDGEYYVAAPSLQPNREAEFQTLLADLRNGGYVEVSQIQVNGEAKLRIFQRTEAVPNGGQGPIRIFDAADYASTFDETLAGPWFAKNGQVSGQTPQHTASYRLGDSVRLVGYSLDREQVAPGGRLAVQLFWEVLAPASFQHKVTAQLIDLDDLHKVAQRDSEPACAKLEEDEWRAGDVLLDRYYLPIAPDARPGDYTLLVGMYDAESQVRLTAYDAAGQPFGDALPLHTIEVMAGRQPSDEDGTP
jgi:hypothetical protein